MFDVTKNEQILKLITLADNNLKRMGFTEHNMAHLSQVAHTSKRILSHLGSSEHDLYLVTVASYMHDIGNVINRNHHDIIGGAMSFNILSNLSLSVEDVAVVSNAIGTHDDNVPISSKVSAALIIADKCDIRRSRVRKTDLSKFDIHDRVNYSVISSELNITDNTIELSVYIDSNYSSDLDFYEIFLNRMIVCKQAAEYLGCTFNIKIHSVSE